MIRGLLLALVLCWSAWATSVQVWPAPSADAATIGAPAGSCAQAPDPQSTDESRTSWGAPSRAKAAFVEPLWKSSAVHAGFAGTPSANTFVEVLHARVTPPPARHAAGHLLRIPLLI